MVELLEKLALILECKNASPEVVDKVNNTIINLLDSLQPKEQPKVEIDQNMLNEWLNGGEKK